MNTKTKVKLALSQRSIDNKVELARSIVLAITGNVNFTSPIPTLTQITAAANDLEAANTVAKDGGKSKIAFMHVKEKLLNDLLTQLGHYVEATANGNASIILSAGIDVKDNNNNATVPNAPNNFTATVSTNEGQATFKWKGYKGTKVYVLEQNNDSTLATNNWQQVDIVTKTNYSLSGLASGQKYAFRIYAVGSAGKSAYSQVVVVKVL